jgi:dipeptidyl aminopeptidase/acylaminoacyl peptidase
MLLWLRAVGRGEQVGAPPPATLIATGRPVATLDLTLDWPVDATVAFLEDQIVGAVHAALDAPSVQAHQGVVVGGHSFGATLALFALTRVPGLAGAIAHSGCYNRTLTPVGFQLERRPYWAVPELYQAFSALHQADQLTRPVLLVHGAEDDNPATPADQAVAFYRCLIATGGHARLLLLPHEGHTFTYRETQRLLTDEHRAWVDRMATDGAR